MNTYVAHLLPSAGTEEGWTTVCTEPRCVGKRFPIWDIEPIAHADAVEHASSAHGVAV